MNHHSDQQVGPISYTSDHRFKAAARDSTIAQQSGHLEVIYLRAKLPAANAHQAVESSGLVEYPIETGFNQPQKVEAIALIARCSTRPTHANTSQMIRISRRNMVSLEKSDFVSIHASRLAKCGRFYRFKTPPALTHSTHQALTYVATIYAALQRSENVNNISIFPSKLAVFRVRYLRFRRRPVHLDATSRFCLLVLDLSAHPALLAAKIVSWYRGGSYL